MSVRDSLYPRGIHAGLVICPRREILRIFLNDPPLFEYEGELTRGTQTMEEPTAASAPDDEGRPYEPPSFTVIPLDCEITAYAPTGDDPLF